MISATEAFSKLVDSGIVSPSQFVKIEVLNSVEILTLKSITEPQNHLIKQTLACDLISARTTDNPVSFNNYLYANFG